MEDVDGDAVARCVFAAFAAVPACRKSLLVKARASDIARPWVPLAGIIIQDGLGRYTCVAAATGMKCISRDKVATSKGQMLHDSHAEVLAMRALNRILLEQCLELAEGRSSPTPMSRRLVDWVATTPGGSIKGHDIGGPKFKIKDNLHIIMYCSEAPCGDSSMEVVMAAQDDPSSWPSSGTGNEEQVMRGRACFGDLGTVRRKPARGDAPISLSKSCSDKLALKQSISLLSSLTALFIDPRGAYIKWLVLPQSQFHAGACERAFGPQGRMKDRSVDPIEGKVYGFRPFKITVTSLEFEHGRRSEAALAAGASLTSTNVATVAFSGGRSESLVNGVLQGRKQDDLRALSLISRRSMCHLVQRLAEQLDDTRLAGSLRGAAYGTVKRDQRLHARQEHKRLVQSTSLKGWQRNVSEDEWLLEGDPAVQSDVGGREVLNKGRGPFYPSVNASQGV